MTAACKESGVTPNLVDHKLFSNPVSRKLVDAVVEAWDRHPPVVGIDATVVVALLPTYVAAGRSEIDLSVSVPPPGSFEGLGPPSHKTKHTLLTG